MTSDRVDFGMYIRGMRLREGLTQAQLGKIIHKTREQISWTENGKAYTSDKQKEILAKALNTSLSILKSFRTERQDE